MSPGLRAAIENVYAVFARHRLDAPLNFDDRDILVKTQRQLYGDAAARDERRSDQSICELRRDRG